MEKQVQYVSSDRTNWFNNHKLSEEQKNKLIENKVNLAKQYLKAIAKAKAK